MFAYLRGEAPESSGTDSRFLKSFAPASYYATGTKVEEKVAASAKVEQKGTSSRFLASFAPASYVSGKKVVKKAAAAAKADQGGSTDLPHLLGVRGRSQQGGPKKLAHDHPFPGRVSNGDCVKEMADVGSWYGEPWSARDLIQQNLAKYFRLAKESPLRSVHLAEALSHFDHELGGKDADEMSGMQGLDKETFANVMRKLLASKDMLDPLLPTEYDTAIEDAFDALDCEKTGLLPSGALIIGSTIFFQGAQQQKSQAVLTCSDCSGCLHLKEYVTPLVMAMTPPEGMPLVPLLIEHCVELMMDTADLTQTDWSGLKENRLENMALTYQEFAEWLSKHCALDFVAEAIDAKVYACWVQNQQINDAVISL
eukprot:gnl/MRDRNA2_/MRDRNA2_29879_c0_seq1.p1 gnl/MRDRNA2_/MRDRNA2_29879_c0~~gnl/MRDRNA2_/MRDRNA2_29879_c0_seq1.p1  ORF type:complete len:368 (+),score=79.79 gnl/MRDRNA2_/MRDRNA2_29879_c0_seq1:84-1187(+)